MDGHSRFTAAARVHSKPTTSSRRSEPSMTRGFEQSPKLTPRNNTAVQSDTESHTENLRSASPSSRNVLQFSSQTSNSPTLEDYSSHDSDDDYRVHSRHSARKRSPTQCQPAPSQICKKLKTQPGKKRVYKMVQRSIRQHEPSQLRQRWSQVDENALFSTPCCKRNCLTDTPRRFLLDRVAYYRSLPRSKRLHALYTMNSSTGHFVFDGRVVCSKFLTRAFRFSPELQTKVRRLPDSFASEISESIKEACTSSSSGHCNIDPTSNQICTTLNEVGTPLQKDAIITFLDRIVEDVADRMPDSEEVHLPFFRKQDVQELFLRDFKQLYPTHHPPSLSYFYDIWSQYRFNVKVRKHPRFTKCATCERIRNALSDAVMKNLPTDSIRHDQRQHIEFVAAERREYMKKIELATLRPGKYLSAVIDGADQHAFSLPHFVTTTKDQRGHGMRVHLVGVLQHAKEKVLRLYTMTDEHATGSNHIVEAVHRFIQDVAQNGPLPLQFFLQLDNCSRENKNKYLMAYLDMLVKLGVFDCVEVGFLPVGHTHSDIDQCFSTTSGYLKYHDAVTLEDLHSGLAHCYGSNTKVERMSAVANWSKLCDESHCLNTVDHITTHRFFKFELSEICRSSETRDTVCFVKALCTDKWRLLFDGRLKRRSSNLGSFLKFIPDISSIPPENVTAPNDEREVFRRIDSEKGRMDRLKVRAMLKLKDEVYVDRSIPFHWDHCKSLEFNCDNILRPSQRTGEIHNVPGETNCGGQEDGRLPMFDYDYDIGTMVAVNTGEDNLADRFWIGQVMDVYRNSDGIVHKLKVLWYEFFNMVGGDIFNAMFRPSLVFRRDQSAKDVPWIGSIDSDTVLVSFNRLTNQKRLPSKLQTDLREMLSS